MKKFGFIRNSTIFSIPYDFRRFPGKFMIDHLKEAIKIAKNKSGRQINIVTHSYGCLQVLHALSKYKRSFIKNNINNVNLISCPLVGSPKTILSLFTGNIDTDLSDSLKKRNFFKTILPTYQSIAMFLPNEMYKNKNKIVFIKDGVNYTVNQLDDILPKDIVSRRRYAGNIIKEIFFFLKINKKYKFVNINCIYSYTNSNNTVESFNYDTKKVNFTIGDDSITLSDLRICNEFVTNSQHIKEIKYQEHSKILQSNQLIQYIIDQNLKSENVEILKK
ncbi:hypothetical protein A3Q56_05855 [Intoshia linei]|uniref:Uncharacterized protein n=1 Tax=Intoshia linei TaxID=1819745 RepID=A0A177AX45_9BILA|nr:hypothetical protein A3Q56_05855 [Intoshia linei]